MTMKHLLHKYSHWTAHEYLCNRAHVTIVTWLEESLLKYLEQ